MTLLPSGTVTFLFTDIEASTRRWEHDAPTMDSALARHDQVLRDAVEAGGGVVVKSTGDGMHAVFSRTTAALAAAVEGQRSLRAERLPAARMALHTGEAFERDGDYFGPTVNRAARIMAIGHGGQILVSDAAAAVVRDEQSVGLRDLGEHRLRDLSRPERVYQVMADGLDTEFPELRSLDVLPTNLPSQLATFVGRDPELVRVGRAIGAHRLVTLTGVGGVGKTRLALQIAADRLSEFRDGAWVSELAPAGDAEAMLSIVATTFSVQQRVGSTWEESIADALRDRELFWVVDNAEHLIDPVARLVDRVLRSAPGVRILATSREGLDLDGEHLLALRSMSLAESNDVDAIVQSDAVRLFVERAGAVRDGFRVDGTNAQLVDELCRRLDGIPLAIELAASRVASLGVSQILALLDERFRLLTGGRRGALERHQTLRAAVDWSFSLLGDDEAAVFTRLAVFAGSFDAGAARSVVSDEIVDGWVVLDAINGLVRKSMVIAEDQPDGSVRYQLLETLRQYARELLERDGEADAWRCRHAEHYVAFSEDAALGLTTAQEFRWRAYLHLELDNVRAAAQWAGDAERVDLLQRLVVALAEERNSTKLRVGPIATRALSLADRLPPAEQGVIMANAAIEAYDRGDSEHAPALLLHGWERGVEPTKPTPALIHYLRAATSIAPPELRHAMVDLKRRWTDADLERAGATLWERARMQVSSSVLATDTGDFALAAEWAELGLALAQRVGSPSILGAAWHSVGSTRVNDDPERGLEAFEACIQLGRQGAAAAGYHSALYRLALLHARRGEPARGASELADVIEDMRPGGRHRALDGACAFALEMFVILDKPEPAAVVLGSVLDGELHVLRDIPVPPDRQGVDLRAIREILGRDRFNELLAIGARMSYDDVLDHIIETLRAASASDTSEAPTPR